MESLYLGTSAEGGEGKVRQSFPDKREIQIFIFQLLKCIYWSHSSLQSLKVLSECSQLPWKTSGLKCCISLVIVLCPSHQQGFRSFLLVTVTENPGDCCFIIQLCCEIVLFTIVPSPCLICGMAEIQPCLSGGGAGGVMSVIKSSAMWTESDCSEAVLVRVALRCWRPAWVGTLVWRGEELCLPLCLFFHTLAPWWRCRFTV